eukprot:2455472-Rhodomonas_salina.1
MSATSTTSRATTPATPRRYHPRDAFAVQCAVLTWAVPHSARPDRQRLGLPHGRVVQERDLQSPVPSLRLRPGSLGTTPAIALPFLCLWLV